MFQLDVIDIEPHQRVSRVISLQVIDPDFGVLPFIARTLEVFSQPFAKTFYQIV